MGNKSKRIYFYIFVNLLSTWNTHVSHSIIGFYIILDNWVLVRIWQLNFQLAKSCNFLWELVCFNSFNRLLVSSPLQGQLMLRVRIMLLTIQFANLIRLQCSYLMKFSESELEWECVLMSFDFIRFTFFWLCYAWTLPQLNMETVSNVIPNAQSEPRKWKRNEQTDKYLWV